MHVGIRTQNEPMEINGTKNQNDERRHCNLAAAQDGGVPVEQSNQLSDRATATPQHIIVMDRDKWRQSINRQVRKSLDSYVRAQMLCGSFWTWPMVHTATTEKE